MSTYLEQIEDAPATDKVIVLKATFGKQQGKTIFQPVRRGAVLLGVEEYTEEEKRKVAASLIVTEDTEVEVEDGFELDLSTAYGRVTWNWLRHQPDIADNQEMAQRMPDAMFFVKDEEKEIETNLQNAKNVATALRIVQEQASASKRLEICRLLGNRMDGMKPVAVEDYLSSIALRTPEKIIDAFKDKNYKSKIFLFNALDKGLIRIENEVYKYGTMTLGISEDQTLEWIKDRNNYAVVEHLKAKVYPEYFADNSRGEDDFSGFGQGDEDDRSDVTPLTPADTSDMSSPGDFGGEPGQQLKPAPGNGGSKKK